MTNALMRSSMSNPLLNLREFDIVLNELFETGRKSEGFPLVKIQEINDELVIQFALAGYPKDSLHIEVQGDHLKVTGDKVEDEGNLFASRAFTWERRDIHGLWNLDKSDVKYENGALTIKVPKKEEKKPRTIKIQ